MKNLNFLITLIMSFFLLLTLTSCSSIGLLDDEITYKEINGFGDFFKVYLILQISIIIIAVILSIFLGGLGYIISLIIHFIWIVSYRDYGFLNVLLLFSIASFVSYVMSLLLKVLQIFLQSKMRK